MNKEALMELAATLNEKEVCARFEHLLYGMSEADAVVVLESSKNQNGIIALLKKPLHETPVKDDDKLIEVAGKGYLGQRAKDLAIQVAAKQIIPFARSIARNMDTSLSKNPADIEDYDMMVLNRACDMIKDYDSEFNSFPAFITRQVQGDFYENVNKSKGATSNTKYAASVRKNVSHAVEEMEQKGLNISPKDIARYINLTYKPSRPYSDKTVEYGIKLMTATTADVDVETAGNEGIYESPEDAYIKKEEANMLINAMAGPEINRYLKIIYNLYLDLAYNGDLNGPLTNVRISEEIEAKTGRHFTPEECKELHERMKKTLKDKISPNHLGARKPVGTKVSSFVSDEDGDAASDIIFELI